MEPQVLIIIGAIAISFISILVYAILAIFYPEWVGITGKVARQAEESHEEGKETGGHVFDKLDK
ncbi:MAG TPA: hypothetical protein VIG33_01115 [Pseudobdellovibrionaceae bacterium]|jgi:hypothetical protein